MTLYTIMPLETVLDGMTGAAETAQTPSQQIWLHGIHMEVIPVAPGMVRIVRLLQCQLNDYLNPQLAPGSIMMYGQNDVQN
ncbi:YlzJ-like family protein [Paenibacillus radicis (ex Gao et al. 2016)]|uniref:YlzJ-like protein n=1 Tax=Paenibacillus radicis (ex Gao et al. 2016) TaxID=1737354 RepID=A0A917HJA1_9BACL|nr:YlzJ-like family protein [Paenibacillus radicis (ex Gao et al. 2016)]GGG80360.1 hypothetical protein GCM10010918_41840 [Paenibacillus radicis (ex Gao et al. 2016)]